MFTKFIDIEKAFVRVNWDTVFEILKKVGLKSDMKFIQE